VSGRWGATWRGSTARVAVAALMASCAFLSLPDAGARAGRVHVVITKKWARVGLQHRGSLGWRRGRGSGGELVRVNARRRYQRLTAGFGVAMTDTAASVIRE